VNLGGAPSSERHMQERGVLDLVGLSCVQWHCRSVVSVCASMRAIYRPDWPVVTRVADGRSFGERLVLQRTPVISA
jgi:hypothetical protein